MGKKKVAIVTNMPSPYRIPLFEKISKMVDLTVYFTNLKKEGDEVIIKDKHRQWFVNSNYNFRFKVLNGYNLSFKGLSYDINLSIVKEISNNDYDVVIVGGYASLTTQIAYFMCKIKKIPIILWTGNTTDNDNFLRKLTLPFIKFLTLKTDAFIAYGTLAKEYLINLGISSDKIFLALNVGDVAFFSKENDKLIKEKDDIKIKVSIKSKINILYVARLVKSKGLDYLIDAYKSLLVNNKDLGLLIIGDGPEREYFEEKCVNMENCHFLNHIQPSKLPLYYTLADVFVLPSFYDRFGIVLSEAMASGLPIISTEKVGGSIDLIKNDYNGYIVKEKDYMAIYDALNKILADPTKLKRMSVNSKKMIKDELNLDESAKGFSNAINYVKKEKE